LEKLRFFIEWLANMSRRAEEGETVSLFKDIVKDIDYLGWLESQYGDSRVVERKWQNVEELQEWIEQLAQKRSERDEKGGLADLVSHMQLMDILERQEQEQDLEQVSLMTLHAAKGLEFPVVYIIGMEEEILPHHSSIEQDMVEEERRLAYVGLTRAMRELTLLYALKRKRAGEMQNCEPSRFLSELPADAILWQRQDDEPDPAERQAKGRAHFSAMRDILLDG
jgi:ATP-dependent DNA helicase Rep